MNKEITGAAKQILKHLVNQRLMLHGDPLRDVPFCRLTMDHPHKIVNKVKDLKGTELPAAACCVELLEHGFIQPTKEARAYGGRIFVVSDSGYELAGAN